MTADANTAAVAIALEGLYESLAADNKDIDARIDVLKSALRLENAKEAVVDPARLFQNNREGRKMLQSYCKRRGVTVTFAK